MDLNDLQQELVNDLLRRRGEKCPECGSPALASTGVAYRAMYGTISVQYGCTNRAVDHPNPTGWGPWSVPLEPHKAQRIGL
jgi:hypothetical protein